MVYYKRSEYGRQFKISNHVENMPIYEELLINRKQRKLRDISHTPIGWDNYPSQSESDDIVEKLALNKLKISEAEKDSDDRSDTRTTDCKSVSSVERSVDSVTKSVDSVAKSDSGGSMRDVVIVQINDHLRKSAMVKVKDNLRKSVKDKLNKCAKDNTEESTASSKTVTEKKKLGKTHTKPEAAEKRPRRPERQRTLSEKQHCSLRSNYAGTSTKASESISSKPFLNYGCGNDRIGEKRTFNIRAQSAVDPTALRAKQRNNINLEKLREKQKMELDRERHRKQRLKQLLNQNSSFWDTTYRTSYPLYDDESYSTVETDPRRKRSTFKFYYDS